MRVLFDTNVLVSAFLAKGVCEDIVEEACEDCVCLWSKPLRAELVGVLKRKAKYDAEIEQAVVAFADLCVLVLPKKLPTPVCRDSDGDVVLATAIAGQADIIVTGARDLLVLGSHRGIRILTPRQFWEILDGHGGSRRSR